VNAAGLCNTPTKLSTWSFDINANRPRQHPRDSHAIFIVAIS
jgi:hypothetical protein